MLNASVAEGRKYGLELDWNKSFQMHIATNVSVVRPDGGPIKAVWEAVYLGGMINCDGKTTPEIKPPPGGSAWHLQHVGSCMVEYHGWVETNMQFIRKRCYKQTAVFT